MNEQAPPPTLLTRATARLTSICRRYRNGLLNGLYFFLLLPLVACFAGRGPFFTWACCLKRHQLGYLSLPTDIATYLALAEPEEVLWARHIEVEVLRDADAYASLRLRGNQGLHHFNFIHPEIFTEARCSGRPLLVLSGHYGSFYTLCIGLSRLGLRIFPIGREVDLSASNPRNKRLFEQINYRCSEAGLGGSYWLYVDAHNRISREFFARAREQANIWVCLDTPGTPSDQGVSCRLLGRSMIFPKALLKFAAKQDAQVLIAWSRVSLGADRRLRREIEFDPLPPTGLTPDQQVEYFAHRLDRRLCQHPEQWFGLHFVDAFLQKLPEQECAV